MVVSITLFAAASFATTFSVLAFSFPLAITVVLLFAVGKASLYLAFDLVISFHRQAFMNNIINIINNTRSWWIVRRMSFSKRIT
jgi:hypothetical protein